LQLISFPEA